MPDPTPSADQPTGSDRLFNAETSGRPAATRGPAAGEQPGDQIGPYRLLEIIGEGGFGVVWLAERREPMVQRIALKIIKPGMDSRAVVARFEQERQALAVMDHPHVARVLDGGVTAGGRPYFVMELVKGEPITAFADRHRLTLRQRLELFIPVCEAVQHAHMKGIIHRDIKPSNILIAHAGDGHPHTVKVIDFGVAKAISHTLTDKTIFTERGQLIGTPEYMSPEQAEMGATDIDTRADVYSLGVVLYELLSGTLPFDAKSLRAAGYAEIQRIIREVDPPKPSTRLSTADNHTGAEIARTRQAERDKIAGELRRELEWIPMKALRKDRARRYASAESLGADVRRYLDAKPLEAAPESRAYLLSKFVKRNRVQVAAAAVVALAVFLGIGVSTYGLMRAKRANAELNEQIETARSAFIDMIGIIGTGSDLAVGQATEGAFDAGEQGTVKFRARKSENGSLDVQLSRLSPDGTTHPAANDLVSVLARLAKDMLRGSQRLEESLRQERDLAQERADQLKQVSDFQSQMLADIDTTKAGIDLMKDIRERFTAALAKSGTPEPDRASQTESLADLLARVNATDTAAAMIDRTILKPAIRTIDERFKDDPKTDAGLRQALADLYRNLGLYDAAQPLQESALNSRRLLLGEKHPDTLESMNSMGLLYQEQGKLEAAETYLRTALDQRRPVLGNQHFDTITSVNDLGVLLQAQGKLAEAEPYFKEALDGFSRAVGDDHSDTITAVHNMGYLLQSQGKFTDAERFYRTALEKSRRIRGDEHPRTITCVNNLALNLQSQGRLDEAEPLYIEAIEKGRRVRGEEHPGTLHAINNMGYLLDAKGSPSAAEPYYREAFEKSRRVNGDAHPTTLRFGLNLVRVLLKQARHGEAMAILLPMESPGRAAFTGEYASRLGTLLWALGRARLANGGVPDRFTLAEANLLEAHPILLAAKDRGPSHKDTIDCTQALIDLYTQWHQAEPAKGYDAKAAEWQSRLDAANAPKPQ